MHKGIFYIYSCLAVEVSQWALPWQDGREEVSGEAAGGGNAGGWGSTHRGRSWTTTSSTGKHLTLTFLIFLNRANGTCVFQCLINSISPPDKLTVFQTLIFYSLITHNCPPPTLNILGQSISQNFNWKLHILSLAKSAYLRFSIP